jgi:outer membrane immunogenic protein
MRLRALLALALVGAAVMSAQAADQAVPGGPSYYPNAYYPNSINWTGWYVGAQFGGAFGRASWTDPFSATSNSLQPTAALGGGQLGVNWMRDSLLLGAEADLAFTGLESSDNGASFSSRWLSLLTGRVGYAFNQFLLYAKGGAAIASVRATVTDFGRVADTGTTTQVGWTVGGGVEYAINSNWSARLEYDYVDLQSRDMILHGSLGPVQGLPVGVDFTIQKVVVGINYRF